MLWKIQQLLAGDIGLWLDDDCFTDINAALFICYSLPLVYYLWMWLFTCLFKVGITLYQVHGNVSTCYNCSSLTATCWHTKTFLQVCWRKLELNHKFKGLVNTKVLGINLLAKLCLKKIVRCWRRCLIIFMQIGWIKFVLPKVLVILWFELNFRVLNII